MTVPYPLAAGHPHTGANEQITCSTAVFHVIFANPSGPVRWWESRVARKNDLEELIEVLDKLLQFRWTTQISRDNNTVSRTQSSAKGVWRHMRMAQFSRGKTIQLGIRIGSNYLIHMDWIKQHASSVLKLRHYYMSCPGRTQVLFCADIGESSGTSVNQTASSVAFLCPSYYPDSLDNR